MLERFLGNFGKEKEVFNGPKIRFHHLSDWAVLVDYYHSRFSKSLWNCDPSELKSALTGIKRKSERLSGGLVEAYNWFAETRVPLEKELYKQKQLKYLRDVVGVSDQSHKKVVKSWSQSQLDIIGSIAKDKNTKILISDQKDGICDSCAIGSHCKDTIFTGSFFDRDDAYQLVVLDLLKHDFWKKRGGFEVLDNNYVILSGQILFDKKFLSVVEKNVSIRFPYLFKDKEIVYGDLT